MTTSLTIDSLEQLLLGKCYYYVYIDDNGIRGTLDKSEYKEGTKTMYYGEENGVKGPLYYNKDFAETTINSGRKKTDDRILVNSIELPILQLNYKTSEESIFFTGKGMRILYFLKDKGVIGNRDKEVVGTVVSTNNGMKIRVPDEYEVYIDNVDIDKYSQRKGLCKLMVKLFILNANVSAGKNLSFSLINAGGEKACRCYTRAFNECGYKVFGYINEGDTKNIKKEMTVELCEDIYKNPADNHEDDDSIYMGFVYTGVINGGKRSGSKRKNRKTKKNRKIKTRKNRKIKR